MRFLGMHITAALGVAIALSLIVHAAIVWNLVFTPPPPKKLIDNAPGMEVVLVNAKTDNKPIKTELLAQANLDMGGNTDDNRRMKSALPAAENKPSDVSTQTASTSAQASNAPQADKEMQHKQQHVSDLEKQAQRLITQLQSKQKVDTVSDQTTAQNQADKAEQAATRKPLTASDLMATNIEMAKLEAAIAKEQDEYQKRPRRKFVGARTQEYKFAMYVESWRQKVERIGNLNYPEAAREQKLYGQLRMTVSIRADGSIENIDINQGSGSAVLDEAAKRIVEMAAPYAAFSDDMKKDTDILSITRTWTFTRQDSMASE